jgi:bile acid:Na+ symporter, BASS family
MQKILAIVNDRDFVLSLALVLGLALGEHTRPLAELSVFTLGLVMVFATSGFSFKSWSPWQQAVRPLLWSVAVNFLLFGLLLTLLAWVFFRHEAHYAFFVGFVLVAAAPPGPSVIPFAAMLGGDNNFSVTGVFGLHFVAMLLTPLFLLIFLGQSLINPLSIFWIMVKLIVIPLIISRFLRHPKVLPVVEKGRDTIIKWGFFLVILPIMGMSSKVFFTDSLILLKMAIILLISMYLLGLIYHVVLAQKAFRRSEIISSTLMMTTKSSAFSAVAAFSFFADDARIALPSAVVSVFVTLFIIVYSGFLRWYENRQPATS